MESPQIEKMAFLRILASVSHQLDPYRDVLAPLVYLDLPLRRPANYSGVGHATQGATLD